ncbi:hypothetical protein JVU11DRAFT_1671 [Chiua virens]|nr:hypothetical protein JVU11DRAFT_1671 [Chiua virens]
MSTSSVIACRWDWCRSTFSSIDALETHVKHDHIWPMKPMSKAEITLMRRLDLQSLHSSLDSSVISRGIPLSSPRTPSASPPKTRRLSCSEEFDTFTQLSSPPRTQSPDKLPVSPAFERLIKQNGHTGLSAAVEMFERTRRLKTNRSPRLPSHSRSPMRRPRSASSGSSQVVEWQLTQDDPGSQSLLAPEPQIENGPTSTKGPPADNETDPPASKEIQNSEQPEPQQRYRLSSIPDPARGQSFRCGSLNVPLRPRSSTNPEDVSQGSTIISQPLMSQVNVSYSSQSQ